MSGRNCRVRKKFKEEADRLEAEQLKQEVGRLRLELQNLQKEQSEIKDRLLAEEMAVNRPQEGQDLAEIAEMFTRATTLTTLHQFPKDSLLHKYLVEHCQPTFSLEKRDYYPLVIVNSLYKLIGKKGLFDYDNPVTVLPDEQLQKALNLKSVSNNQLGEHVAKTMIPYLRLRPQSALEKVTRAEGIFGFETFTYPEGMALLSSLLEEEIKKSPTERLLHRALKFATDRDSLEREFKAQCTEDIRNDVLGYTGVRWKYKEIRLAGKIASYPFWTSEDAEWVKIHMNDPGLNRDIEGDYVVSERLQKLLRLISERDVADIMPFRIICNLVSRYIMAHKDEVLDPRYPKIVNCNQALKDAFGLNYIHRWQTSTLIWSQLKAPSNENEKPESEPPSKKARTENVRI